MNERPEHDDHSQRGLRHVRELEGHLAWLDTFSGVALGVLSAASGIYTYLGVSGLLDDTGAFSFFAAAAYSIAVSVGIFVFWSYMLRLLPAMQNTGNKLKLTGAMALGCAAIIAMSSWLNAAALAGAAAVEQHLATTVQSYQSALEESHDIAISAQALERDVARVRQSFEDLSAQEADGNLSGLAGRGAVFRVLSQKASELSALEEQIAAQSPLIDSAFDEGNALLSQMRALIVEQGPVEARSVAFSEEAVRLAGLVAQLRQLSVAPLVDRAAADLSASVVLPELDGSTPDGQMAQQQTISSVMDVLQLRADSLAQAADQVLARPAPADVVYTPVSAADAVILYAGNFVPSWAGAIAIDLLPAVLVLILMVTQSAIRENRHTAPAVDGLTLGELRAAMYAMREVEQDSTPRPTPAPAPMPKPDTSDT
ncbi:hypothetical protein [Donghicola eburneus]|uniref:Putative membrane protein n=1 Tax=Donghicola eburneus TaxID=393278 RepID=A0A1M4N918_9RHOB|nr:hypothetical protein [Donghicola eburneus]SCM69686.1 putative membrane protein [Donghicola eburneus]SFQ63678.1 hypothetical protein SAMN05421764_10845 [Donghicola eburneus]